MKTVDFLNFGFDKNAISSRNFYNNDNNIDFWDELCSETYKKRTWRGFRAFFGVFITGLNLKIP